jgi:hypothetical protein
MADITSKELFATLKSFQKDKIPGPNGLPVEFYLKCFDFLGQNLVGVVEYSRSTDQMLLSFNATFISLIPKEDNPRYFNYFRPISRCNNIYKIITKLIAKRLLDFLS